MKDKIFEIINKILNYETSKQVYINYVRDTLSSKIIKINIEDISFDIFLSFDDDKITILQGSDKVDVEISGTLTSFIFYTTSRGSDLFSSKINISGDVESANSLNKFLKESGVIKAIIIEILGQKTSSSLFSILEPIKKKLDESNDFEAEAAAILATTLFRKGKASIVTQASACRSKWRKNRLV